MKQSITILWLKQLEFHETKTNIKSLILSLMFMSLALKKKTKIITKVQKDISMIISEYLFMCSLRLIYIVRLSLCSNENNFMED